LVDGARAATFELEIQDARRRSMHDEPSRQVHLDFHTSELIPDIGAFP
jgi:hypothetical protein